MEVDIIIYQLIQLFKNSELYTFTQTKSFFNILELTLRAPSY